MTELQRKLSEVREEAESYCKEADELRKDYNNVCKELEVRRLAAAMMKIYPPHSPTRKQPH